MSAPHEIPPPRDEDYLDRVEGHLALIRDFKQLVIDLSGGDLSGEDYFGEDLANAEIDDKGRLLEPFNISHGHYDVTPIPIAAVIDEVEKVDASVMLSRPIGGRRYKLGTTSVLGGLLTVTYFEDGPDKIKPYAHGYDENILRRIHLARESAQEIGIHHSDMQYVELMVTGIQAADAVGRLVASEACECG